MLMLTCITTLQSATAPRRQYRTFFCPATKERLCQSWADDLIMLQDWTHEYQWQGSVSVQNDKELRNSVWLKLSLVSRYMVVKQSVPFHN